MSLHRRYAADYSDSLNSYRTVDSDTEYEDDRFKRLSKDSLEENIVSSSTHSFPKENRSALSHTTRSSKHSTILAGSSLNSSLLKNGSVPSVFQSVPDLNKCVVLFESEKLPENPKHVIGSTHTCSNTEYEANNDKENSNPQCGMENIATLHAQDNIKSAHNNISTNIKVPQDPFYNDSKRDNNHNISQNENSASRFPLPTLQTEQYKNKKDESHDMSLENREGDVTSKHFESILYSLDNQLNRLKECKDSKSEPNQILKRLSNIYAKSPNTFTEKLLTIIEESVSSNDEEACNTSAMDLSRLITELKEMFELIEDVSAPEWPESPLSIASNVVQAKPLETSIENQNVYCQIDRKGKAVLSPRNVKSLTCSPISSPDRFNLSKRLQQKLSNQVFNISMNTMTHSKDTTASFESLETKCKKLFCEEQESVKSRTRRSVSLPRLMSMSYIHNVCEQQLASLNVSEIADAKLKNTKKNAMSLQSTPLCPRVEVTEPKSFQCQSNKGLDTSTLDYYDTSQEKGKSRERTLKAEINNYMKYNPDELEKTILQDIAEKRKRCLDTAKLIMEINADPAATKAHGSLRTSPLFTDMNELDSNVNNEAKFLNTLMSCKKYHGYLEKQKSVLNVLQTSDLSLIVNSSDHGDDEKVTDDKTEKRTLCPKKSKNIRNSSKCYLSPNVRSLDSRKSPAPKKRGKENDAQNKNLKPKLLFTTPGKSPNTKKVWKRDVYFTDTDKCPKKSTEDNILKSPHADGLYRLNYNTIISPVGMYIKGTDMQLIKNVRPKKDCLLLTPAKKNVQASPGVSSAKNTPLRITKSQEKASLKFSLTPKLFSAPKSKMNLEHNEEDKSPIVATTNTPDINFKLPRVNYKLPLQVHTIKKTGIGNAGKRVKGLVESAQNKVVIRHEGRINSVQKKSASAKNNETVEIDYNPEDESIHVEQVANKTNFIRGRKIA